jgi:hypothetical protein
MMEGGLVTYCGNAITKKRPRPGFARGKLKRENHSLWCRWRLTEKRS